MRIRTGLKLFRQAAAKFVADDAGMLAAALAFYAALSMAPFLILCLWVLSMVGQGNEQQIADHIGQVLGPQAAQGVVVVLRNATGRPGLGSVAGIVGTVTLVSSAAGVFMHLQRAMNLIWSAGNQPGRGFIHWVVKRLISMGMVFAIVVLLFVSLLLNTTVAFITAELRDVLPILAPLLKWGNLVASLMVFTLLFAAVFKWMPDTKVPWARVWIGALTTAVLFAAGNTGIGLYLGRSGVGSAYGAAGSLIALLVWIYYSSLIVFFGAEITHAWFRHREGSDVAGIGRSMREV